jgi:hypothetical protein
VPAQVTGLPPSGKCSDLIDNSTAVRFAGAIRFLSAQAILSLRKDLNGDGCVEYLWLDTKGVTTAFLNLGPTQTGQPLIQLCRTTS